jgi:NAD-dependent SIR2 family protein deacetylase
MNPCKEDYEEILSTELQAIKQKLLVVTQWVDELRRLANSRAVQIDHLLAECQKKDLLIQELKTKNACIPELEKKIHDLELDLSVQRFFDESSSYVH